MQFSKENIFPLIRTRLDILRALRELSEEQLNLIQLDRVDELEGLLDIKSAVLLRLQQWQWSHSSSLSDWNQIEQLLPFNSRDECLNICRQTDIEVHKLEQLERASHSLLQQERHSLKHQLSSVSRASLALHAYDNSDRTTSQLSFDINQ